MRGIYRGCWGITKVNDYIFDAILQTGHERSLTITDHAVEEGSEITDHSYVNHEVVSLEIAMSDAEQNPPQAFSTRHTRSISAFDALETLYKERVKCTIVTKLAHYEDMLLQTLNVVDDYKTVHGLRAVAVFRQVVIAKTDTVTLPNRTSAAPHKTGNTNRGTQRPEPDNRSALRAAADLVRPPADMLRR